MNNNDNENENDNNNNNNNNNNSNNNNNNNWCDHKDRAFTESSSPRHSAPPQTGTRGLRL